MKRIFLAIGILFGITTSVHAQTVMDVAQKQGANIFYGIIKKSEKLWAAANAAQGAKGSMAPYTVFAPTDAALKPYLSGDKEELKDMIQLLVVPGREINNKEELDDDTLPTVGGELLLIQGDNISLEDGSNSVSIVGGPHKASNGVVYMIDGMIKANGGDTPKAVHEKPEETKKIEPTESVGGLIGSLIAKKKMELQQPAKSTSFAQMQSNPLPAQEAQELTSTLKSLTDAVASLDATIKNSAQASNTHFEPMHLEKTPGKIGANGAVALPKIKIK